MVCGVQGQEELGWVGTKQSGGPPSLSKPGHHSQAAQTLQQQAQVTGTVAGVPSCKDTDRGQGELRAGKGRGGRGGTHSADSQSGPRGRVELGKVPYLHFGIKFLSILLKIHMCLPVTV